MTTGNVLISAADLQQRLAAGAPTVLLDVRWALGRTDGREDYRSGHLPGALYVDLETELAAPASPAEGRHPLPEPEAFAASVRSWGVSADDVVVAYDDCGNLSAARLWWLLRHAGFGAVRLLDGGLEAWRSAGYGLEQGDVSRPGHGKGRPGSGGQGGDGGPGLGWGHMPVITLEEAAHFPRSGLLLDARAGERYRGEVEPVDPRAGHIPGAVSAPTAGNLDDAGRFLPPEQLRARFAELGVSPESGASIAVYCGSGITASHEVAALAEAGIVAALYPGSWSQWSSRSDLPLAT